MVLGFACVGSGVVWRNRMIVVVRVIRVSVVFLFIWVSCELECGGLIYRFSIIGYVYLVG